MHTKRQVALTLATIMTISAPSGVYAAGGTTDIIQSDLTDNRKNVSVPVNANISSSFTVSLPSEINLERAESGYGYSGTVGVKGDIGAGTAIKVSPDSTVTMHDVTFRPEEVVGLPAQGETPAYNHKDPVSVSSVQTKKLWKTEELTEDTYSNTDFTMSIARLPSGKWEGQINFDICYLEQYVSVTATNEAGGSINAYANEIIGTKKANIISALVSSKNIASEDDVDVLIEVVSDDFEGMTNTTFDLTNIATNGDKVAILHFNNNNEWELVCIETMETGNMLSVDFSTCSPVAFVKVDESGNFNVISQVVELMLGETYSFGGYEWVAAEVNSGYAVLQSTGVTGGAWPGYKMSGTLTNATGNTITLTAENTNYTAENIDGYDISGYNDTTRDLYAAINSAEYTAATYGKGLYLISKGRSETPGYDHYFAALKSAAAQYSSFGADYGYAWLGTVHGSLAWCVHLGGGVGNNGQDHSYVLAPAFNIDLTKIKLSDTAITLK